MHNSQMPANLKGLSPNNSGSRAFIGSTVVFKVEDQNHKLTETVDIQKMVELENRRERVEENL